MTTDTTVTAPVLAIECQGNPGACTGHATHMVTVDGATEDTYPVCADCFEFLTDNAAGEYGYTLTSTEI